MHFPQVKHVPADGAGDSATCAPSITQVTTVRYCIDVDEKDAAVACVRSMLLDLENHFTEKVIAAPTSLILVDGPKLYLAKMAYMLECFMWCDVTIVPQAAKKEHVSEQ